MGKIFSYFFYFWILLMVWVLWSAWLLEAWYSKIIVFIFILILNYGANWFFITDKKNYIESFEWSVIPSRQEKLDKTYKFLYFITPWLFTIIPFVTLWFTITAVSYILLSILVSYAILHFTWVWLTPTLQKQLKKIKYNEAILNAWNRTPKTSLDYYTISQYIWIGTQFLKEYDNNITKHQEITKMIQDKLNWDSYIQNTNTNNTNSNTASIENPVNTYEDIWNDFSWIEDEIEEIKRDLEDWTLNIDWNKIYFYNFDEEVKSRNIIQKLNEKLLV